MAVFFFVVKVLKKVKFGNSFLEFYTAIGAAKKSRCKEIF